ncbi:MAG: STAS domain-containing protein [Planctomyces sp.]|nr:STAS domain-containing protein [Planctomyces sp.]
MSFRSGLLTLLNRHVGEQTIAKHQRRHIESNRMPEVIEVTQMKDSEQLTASQLHLPLMQLSGSQTIANAEELHRSLRDAVTAHSRVNVLLDDVTELDAAALQILATAVKDQVVELQFQRPVSADLQYWFQLAGLSSLLPAV